MLNNPYRFGLPFDGTVVSSTTVFPHTGEDEYIMLLAGITYNIKLQGGGGGGGNNHPGGGGGFTSFDYTPSVNKIFKLQVGAAGLGHANQTNRPRTYGGGGASGARGGASGGGGSFLWDGLAVFAVAGGGGGAGSNEAVQLAAVPSWGGYGGGASGTQGGGSGFGGYGGTQSAAGAGGSGSSPLGEPGSGTQGGDGTDLTTNGATSPHGGGGGGGGYFGGGGGGGDIGGGYGRGWGGGGGSGFTALGTMVAANGTTPGSANDPVLGLIGIGAGGGVGQVGLPGYVLITVYEDSEATITSSRIYATWSQTDKGGSTLNSDNLTFSSMTTGQSARSTIGVSSGKWYFEVIEPIESVNRMIAGVGTSEATLGNYLGSDLNGWGYMPANNGHKTHGGTLPAYGRLTKTVGVKLDMDNKVLSFTDEIGDMGVAYTNLPASVFAMVSGSATGPSMAVANFGATPFARAVPEGYNAGLYRDTLPFGVLGLRFDSEDKFLDSVSAHLHFDEMVSVNSLVDSGPKNHGFSLQGSAVISTQNSLTGGKSLLLEGTTSYAMGPSGHTDFYLDGDFAIECRLRPSALTNNYGTILGNNSATFSTPSRFLMVYGQNAPTASQQRRIALGGLNLNGGSINATVVESTTQVVVGQWYNVRITRIGTTVRLFINGVLEATGSSNSIFDFGHLGVLIGKNGWDGAQGFFAGNIDELRITKGVGRYSTTHVISADYLPDATTFVDEFARVIKRTGAVLRVSGAKHLAGGYFSASGAQSIFTLPYVDYGFHLSDFNWRFWVNMDTPAAVPRIMGNCNGLSWRANQWTIGNASNGIQLFVYNINGAATTPVLSSLATGLTGWQLVCITRTHSRWIMTINGVFQSEAFSSASLDGGGNQVLSFGSSGIPGEYYNGYLDDLLFEKGWPRDYRNFVPPLTSVFDGGLESRDTVLLRLAMNGANNGTSFPDTGDIGWTPTYVGAVTSTAVVASGSASGYFGGGGAYLQYSHHAMFDVVNKPWQIDMFVHPTVLTGVAASLVSKRSGNDGWSLALLNITGVWQIFAYRSGHGNIQTTLDVPLNQLSHIRYSHDGRRLYMFVNGVLANPGGTAVLWNNNAHPLYIGTSIPGSEIYQGYIDQLSWTVGEPVSTSGFVPPTLIVTPTAPAPQLLWLDASDVATLTESGGRVTQWRDKSVMANHANEGAGSLGPSRMTNRYRTGAINFTGNKGMSLLNPITLSGSMVVFIVAYWNPSASASDQNGITFSDTRQVPGGQFISVLNTTGVLLQDADSFYSEGGIRPIGGRRLYRFAIGASPSTTVIERNGETVAMPSGSNLGNAWNIAMQHIGLQTTGNYGGNDHQIAEIRIYSSLSVAQQDLVEAELAAKWELPV